MGAGGGAAALAAGRGRAGRARRERPRRPVLAGQRRLRAARRARHDRGQVLPGAGLLGAAGRGRPGARRDRARPPGARALPAPARRAGRLQAALPEPGPDPHRARRRQPAQPGGRGGAGGRRDPRLDLGGRARPAQRAAAARARRRRQDRGAAAAARAGRCRHPAAAARRPAVHGAGRRRGAAEAAGRLGIATARLCVLAAQLTGSPHGVTARSAAASVAEQVADHAAESARAESERQRFCDALALHVAAIHPKAAAALAGSVAYAVLPLTPGGDEEARAVRVAESFLARVGPRHAANIGVGRLALSLAQVARSRADADRALRVLRTRGVSGQVAGYAAVHFESLLLQVADVAAAEEQAPTGPYRRLLDHDAEHGTELAATLEAYLDAFGDVSVAAARVHVHPNTFRYRLRRLAEIGGLDLGDPDARLTVQLQLRIFGRRD
ncbi:PucR family transcriptional regulator [Nonomuraea thailandensis]